MSELINKLENHEIEQAVNRIGLNISEPEVSALKSGDLVLLNHKGLSEIGSALILAETMSAVNSVKNVTFEDLDKVLTEPSKGSGIPIYYWNFDNSNTCCLLLTLVDGIPAVKISD